MCTKCFTEFSDTFANGELQGNCTHTSAIGKLQRHVHILIKFVRHIVNSFESCDHSFDKNPQEAKVGYAKLRKRVAITICADKICKIGCKSVHVSTQVVPKSNRLSQN